MPKKIPGQPGPGKPGRPPGSRDRSQFIKANAILRAAKETAATPEFRAWAKMCSIAGDAAREYDVLIADEIQNHEKIVEAREHLANMLRWLLPYEKPRLTAVKVSGDKNAPLFDLSTLSESQLLSLRKIVLDARQIEED